MAEALAELNVFNDKLNDVRLKCNHKQKYTVTLTLT